MHNIGDLVERVIVIAHKEDTKKLEDVLRKNGFNVQVRRPDYTKQEKGYPAAIRCLINHAGAWEAAASSEGWTLVCEADFVPCKGFNILPSPFYPSRDILQIAWLYSIGPVVYHYGESGFYGHNAGGVAYILDSRSASAWLKLYDRHRKERDFNDYYQWDVKMPVQLRREYGVHCYISYKCYGEHGGLPNYEHTKKGFRAWHQAESLARRLEFLPAYARDSRLRYLGYRIRARLRGIYKLFMGKYFDGWAHFMRLQRDRWKKLAFVLRRVLT